MNGFNRSFLRQNFGRETLFLLCKFLLDKSLCIDKKCRLKFVAFTKVADRHRIMKVGSNGIKTT
jgi:hypothetical protein